MKPRCQVRANNIADFLSRFSKYESTKPDMITIFKARTNDRRINM